MLAPHKKVDIWECARVDRNTPIEETVTALADLIRDGQLRGIGLSEVSSSTIRRAAAVHPIAAVEVELVSCSLFLSERRLSNSWRSA